MNILALERVSKRYRNGRHTIDTLTDVSLGLDRGELVAVWGQRRSGRSTLLRLAGGIEAPDTGTVRFQGRDLAASSHGTLPDGIAYCARMIRSTDAPTVLAQLVIPQLARGLARKTARARAVQALERTGVRGCGGLPPCELDIGDAVRVNIARALTGDPIVLLIDEPTSGVDLLERNGVLDLLRSLAREDGIAILACVGESAGLFAIDRGLTLSEGELHGPLTPELAPVVDLRVPQSA